jgi:subtilisin family serine protease
MKRWIWVLPVVMMCIPWAAFAGQTPSLSDEQWAAGHLIVNFRSEVGTLYDTDSKGEVVSLGIPSVDELLTRYRVTAVRRLVGDKMLNKLKVVPDFYRLVLLECPPETDLAQMITDFKDNPLVEYAEPDLLRPLCERVPNDPLWTSQWDKRLMRLPMVWEYTTGSRDIIVCAIDGGTYWPHEDFFANLWVNPGEDVNHNGLPYLYDDYPGDPDDINGIDDDDDGLVDDLIAWDFIANEPGCAPGEDCDSHQDNDPYSINDHGTHVLGLMGAVGNNGIGVAGAAWNVRIMACRAGFENTRHEGKISGSAAIPCMLWAVAHGASVLNMSYGSPGFSQSENNALQSCWANGAVLCAAAGNETTMVVTYPAGYANVVAVGSVDENDVVSVFSNYGVWVDCFAPGENVMSTVIPGYTEYQGTSMASPNAAGVFAVIWSLFPNLTNQELVDLVLNHCVSITAQNPTFDPSYLGHGRIDAQSVVASVLPHLSLEGTGVYGDNDGDSRLESGENGNLIIVLHNDEGWSPGHNLQITVVTQDPNLTLANNSFAMPTIAPGTSLDNTNNPVQVTVGSVSGSYWAQLTVQVRGPNSFALDIPFTLRINRPQTILIADDGVYTYHSFYMSSLLSNDAGYDYDLWTVSSDGEPVLADITEYPIVMWVCGDEASNTLTPADQAVLEQYLNGGGKLMLVGQNIDEDISASTFYSDYLHCQSGGAAGYRNLNGVSGDPISDGTSLLLMGGGCGGNGLLSPSQIVPINGGVGFYDYSTGGTGAVRFENGTYRTAYFAFALEAACGMLNTTHHSVVVQRVMQWFGATYNDVQPPVSRAMPVGFALQQNYPNPFNPTTRIVFNLPRSMRATLRVFDTLGRQVAVLVNGQMPAGAHTVTFDGSQLASGIYLAQLVAGDFTATQRMVLLK